MGNIDDRSHEIDYQDNDGKKSNRVNDTMENHFSNGQRNISDGIEATSPGWNQQHQHRTMAKQIWIWRLISKSSRDARLRAFTYREQSWETAIARLYI